MVVLTGGGIKSAVVAGRSAAGNELIFVHADYGQPSAAAERRALPALARAFPSTRVVTLDLPYVAQLQSTDLNEPGESSRDGETADDRASRVLSSASLRGFVSVLMSLGVQCALRLGASKVITGLTQVCDATHLGLPPVEGSANGQREFIYSFNVMMESVLPRRSMLAVEAPLMDLEYTQIIKLAQRFRVPLERTWTCGQSRPHPCGRCEPCQARARAFVGAGVVDPLSTVVPQPG
jgi:7-cyano-7-deazaguanine synthase